MSDIMDITRTLDRKAREFEANKEMYTERITEGFRVAKDKLDRAEKELLRKLEVFFGSNVFSEQMVELDAESPAALEKAAAVARLPVPADFGPDEDAFGRLYKEIARLADRVSLELATPPPPPKGLAAQGVGKGEFHDGVTLTWSAVVPDAGRRVECVQYKVQMTGEHGAARVYDSAGTSCAFQNLKAGTMYAFRVLCVWDGTAGPWSDAVEFTTSPVPAAAGLRCSEAKECTATIVWDAAPVGVTWEAEVRKDEVGSAFRKVYEGAAPTCVLEDLECGCGYAVRVCARLDSAGACGEWSKELHFRTKKWSCSWKPCPASVDDEQKYTLSRKDNRLDVVATRINYKSYKCAIVIGSNPIPIGATVSWRVNLDQGYIDGCTYNHPDPSYMGITQIGMDQNKWNTYGGSICVGSSFNVYTNVGEKCFFIYGRLDKNHFTVVVDTQKRELIFTAVNVILGTVRQIPLDKPLVPFVGLGYLWKSAELVINE